jgi:thioesterase domain-containing protein
MAASYVEAIRRVQPSGPYHIGGHSFGAYVAYEMTQHLRAKGEHVGLLAVLDAEARPTAGDGRAIRRSGADRLRRVLGLLGRFFGRPIAFAEDELEGVAPEDVIPRLAAKLVEAQLLPAAVGEKRLQAYLRVAEATDTAFESYRTEGAYRVPVALFRAREVHAEDGTRGDDAALGWGPLATKSPRVSWVPGDHVTMITSPHVATLGGALRDALLGRCAGLKP